MAEKLVTAEQLAKELRDGVDTVVAFEQTKKEKMKLQSQQVRWYQDRNIQSALIPDFPSKSVQNNKILIV